MFTDEFKTTYPDLLRAGLVSCYKEFCFIESLQGVNSRHWCHLVFERCFQRKGDNGMLVCRIPERPICFNDYFLVKDLLYSADANEVLLDLDIAHPEERTLQENRQLGCADETKLVVHDKLVAGTHQYKVYSSEGCKFIPTMPLLGITMRSSTNAQVCSDRFNCSYIAKYTVGKEGRKIPTFDFKDNRNEIEIITKQGADPNTIISGVKIWESSEKNKKKVKSKNIMEVSRTELSGVLLDFDYTHTNVIFSHANTLSPEYRPSVLKRKTNNENNEESPPEEREVHFDPNEDRSHLSDE